MITTSAQNSFQIKLLIVSQSDAEIEHEKLFENMADDLERVERLFKYIEYFMLPQFNAPRNKT